MVVLAPTLLVEAVGGVLLLTQVEGECGGDGGEGEVIFGLGFGLGLGADSVSRCGLDTLSSTVVAEYLAFPGFSEFPLPPVSTAMPTDAAAEEGILCAFRAEADFPQGTIPPQASGVRLAPVSCTSQ